MHSSLRRLDKACTALACRNVASCADCGSPRPPPPAPTGWFFFVGATGASNVRRHRHSFQDGQADGLRWRDTAHPPSAPSASCRRRAPPGPQPLHGATTAEPARAVNAGPGDPGHGPPQNHRVPGAVTRHGCLPHPAELPADGRALARPAMHLAHQHGLTGLNVCAQVTSKSRAACASHACISGRKSFETMC